MGSTDPKSENGAPKSRRYKVVRLAGRSLLGLLAFLSLAASGIWWLTSTDDGLNTVAGWAEGPIANAIDGTIRIDGLSGSLWDRIEGRAIALEGPDGFRLDIVDFHLDWTPSALFDGILRFSDIGARLVTVILPSTTDTGDEIDGSTENGTPSLSPPQLPFAIAIERIDLPAVDVETEPGTRFTLRLAGKASVEENGTAGTTIGLDVRQNGATYDTASIRASVSGFDDPVLTLHAAIDLPADGLAMRLIDPPAEFRRRTRIRLDGDGPAHDWSGTLSVQSDALGQLEGKTHLRNILSNSPGLGFDGRIDLQDAASLDLPPELGGETTVGFDASLEDGRLLTLERLQIERPNLASLDARGTVDLDTLRIDADGATTISPEAAALADTDIGFEAAEGTFTVNGTPDAPNVELWLQASEFTATDIAFGHVAVSAAASSEPSGTYRLDATARAERSRWPDDAIQEVAGETLNVDISAGFTPDLSRISDLDLTLMPADLRIRGDLALTSDGIASPNLRIDAARLKTFEPFLEQPLDGAASIQLTETKVRNDGSISTGFDVRIDRLTLVDTETTGYMGQTPNMRGTLEFASSGDLAVELSELQTATGTLSGAIRLRENFARLVADLEGTVDLNALPIPSDIDITEPRLSFSASLDGLLDRPGISLETDPIDLRVQDFTLNRTRLGADISWSGENPVAKLDAKTTVNGTPIDLSGRITAATDHLELADLSFRMPGASLSGAARLDGYVLPAEGALDFRVVDPSAIAALAELPPLSGRANGSLRFEPGQGEAAQAIAIEATLDGISLTVEEEEDQPITLSKGHLTARIGDLLGLKAIAAELTASGLSAGPATIATLDARFDGDGAQARLDLSAEGSVADLPRAGRNTPISLTLNAAGEGLDSAEKVVSLNRLDAGFDTIDIALRTPARLTIGEGGVRSLTTDVTISDGILSLSYAREETAAQLEAHLTDLPLAPFLAFNDIDGIAARLDADLEISETSDLPTNGMLRADLSGIAVQDTDTPENLGISLQGDLGDGRFSTRLDGMGTGLEETRISLSTPVDLSLIERTFRLDLDAPLEGSAQVGADLGKLWPYAPLPEHAVVGRMDIDLNVAGSIAKPSITGSAALSDGIYEHLEYGTLLRNFAGKWGFDQESIVIERLAANDPEGGEMSMRGRAHLTAPLTSAEADIRFDNLQLVHTDAIKLRADADLTVGTSGSNGAQSRVAIANQLTGIVTLRRGEVDLAAALPPSTPTLDAREEGAPPPPSSDGNGGTSIGLDIDIRIPGQLFVRGRGIDSEWEGTLQVAGTSDEPIVSGVLTARRGRFDVIGKSFSLEESTIRFSGGDTIDPILGIRGVYEADDLEVVARLVGPASDPEIVLESQPPLPRDEILSRVLFGKSKGRLSAVEAAQLAASANELSGGGGGFDVLGSIRQFVGVDVLQVDAGDDGPEVRTGKYVAEGVYVGAKQGTSPGSTSVEVEVELLPNISVNSETGQTDSKIGIQFEWDY